MQPRHDTAAARKTAGVDSSLWHEFSPGQRVMTREGIAGVVDRVEDGPHPGSEHYVVTLDNSLGGGQYSAGELRPLGTTSSQRTAAKTATEPHQASEDYPELGTILEDRPPLEYAFKQMGSLVDDDGDLLVLAQTIRAQSHGVADDLTLCSLCFTGSHGEDVEPVLVFATDTAHATCVAKAAADIAEVERGMVVEDDEDLERDYSTLDPEDSGEVVEQVWSRQSALRWTRNEMGEYEAGRWRIVPSSPNTTGFPKGWVLVEAETHRQIEHYPYLGDAKAAAEEREPKEGSKQAAPYGQVPTETGEGFEWGSWYVIEEGNTANILAGPFSTRAAAEGWIFGTSHTTPVRTEVAHENRLEYGRVASKDPVTKTAENLLVTHGYGPDRWSFDWCRFRRNRDCYYPMELDVSGTQQAGYPVWTPYHRGACPRHAWDEQKDCPVAEPGPKSNEPKFYPDATVPWSEGGQRWERFGRFASKDVIDDFTFAFTASWRDVQGKAARIRQEGGVRIISSPTKGSSNEYYIVAEVNGDTNVYQTRLMRQPGKATAVAMWECGCAWGHYAWGRSGRWKRYEGRMCSHALAVLYEAQSQMGFDRSGPITEQPSEPSWRKDTEPQVKYPAPPIPEWRVGSMQGNWRPIDLDQPDEAPIRAVGFLPSKPIVVRYRGRITEVTLEDDGTLTDRRGNPVEPRDLKHPRFHPRMGLDPRDRGDYEPIYKGSAHDALAVWNPDNRAKRYHRATPEGLAACGANVLDPYYESAKYAERRGKQPCPTCFPTRESSLHSALREGRVQPLPAVEAAADMNGAMVAIKPPQRILSTLRNTGEMSEDFSNLHVTIAYFGDKSGLDVAGLKRAVHAFAADAHQITARISGYAIWKDMQGNRILVATIDSPGIEEWRARLIDHLAGTGISPMRTHGFVPHITMAYGYDKTEVPASQPRGDFSANSVWIVLGRDWTEVPLGGGSSPYGRVASKQAVGPHHKDDWHAGERAWFEYHCLESHDSADAQAWYRSHQQVTVLEVAEQQEEFSKDPTTTFDERMSEGMPRVYRVRWDDGYEHDVFEDELMTSSSGFHRPDPPSDPHTASKQASVEYDVVYRDPSLPEGEAMITATDGGQIIGALRWNYYADPPVVVDMSVDEAYRRQGIGTGLFEKAKANESRLEHSDVLLDDGREFVRSFGQASVAPLETEDHFPFEAEQREAMADRSGIPEVDEAIEAFLKEPGVAGLCDPSRSHGACEEVTEQFVAFAEARGLKAYVTHTNLDEMGYEITGGGGEVLDEHGDIVTGHYHSHTVASIYVPGRRFPIEVDFTASQYGYSDHPKVLAATAATFAKTCDFCDQPATKAVMWAEGMAYVPACEDHVQEAKDAIDDPADIDFVRDIKDGEKVGVLHEAAWDDTDDPDVGYGTLYDDGWADQATDGKPSRMDHLEGTDRSEYAQGVADANGGVLPDSMVWPAWDLPEDGVEAAEDLDLHVTEANRLEEVAEAAQRYAEDIAEAELHEEPEPALPRTDGDEEEGGLPDDAGTDDERFTSVGSIPGEDSRSWLMDGGSSEGDTSTNDIAARAQQVLAAKAFTPEEQAALINEGEDGTIARNIGDLDIAGTHYEALDRLEDDDELDVWDLLG